MCKVARSVIPLLLVVSLILAACAPAPSAPQDAAEEPAAPVVPVEPVKLTFVGWGGPEEIGVFQELVDTFNARYPDIIIEYQPMPDDYVTKLKT
ncbi:MAG: hypothetical protein ROW52_11645, partial [Anaerolineaceae bacterium]